ncbi:MAG: CaiB/BaiF CoA transferase family protein [Actinomycetes bacterium]
MARSGSTDASSTPPLEGLLVADLSRVLAGPMATSLLADLGATVVKVERPGAGDDTRSWGPPWTATASSYYESANRSKRSITLDLREPEDAALARELCRRADVVVENFRSGTLDRYGLGYEQVSAENPAVVYCSLTGFGSGEGAGRPGYDFVVQAVGGLMSITGDRDGDPHKVGVALVDVLTGKDAVIGILAALEARRRDGVGQHVEVNLLSSLLGSLVNQASGYLASDRSPGRMGNQHPSIAPYETLHCRDGLIAVACGNDGQFARLATVLGAPGLATDERFRTNPARVANRAELVTALEALLAGNDAAAWEERLLAADVPAGRVNSIEQAIALADSLGLEPLNQTDDEHLPQVRHPITYSRSAVTPPTAPPRLGEHDDEIRAWLQSTTPTSIDDTLREAYR